MVKVFLGLLFTSLLAKSYAQQINDEDGILKVSNKHYSIILNSHSGKISFTFTGGARLKNSIAILKENNSEPVKTSALQKTLSRE